MVSILRSSAVLPLDNVLQFLSSEPMVPGPHQSQQSPGALPLGKHRWPLASSTRAPHPRPLSPLSVASLTEAGVGGNILLVARTLVDSSPFQVSGVPELTLGDPEGRVWGSPLASTWEEPWCRALYPPSRPCLQAAPSIP